MVDTNNYYNEITFLIQAGTKIIEIVSFEYQRVFKMFADVSKKNKWPIFTWDPSVGIQKLREDGSLMNYQQDAGDCLGALNFLTTNSDDCILLMEGFENVFNPNHPMSNLFIRKLVQFSRKTDNKAIVLFTQHPVVPSEIKSEVAVVELPLSDENVIREIVEGLVRRVNQSFFQRIDITDEVVNSALGLTYSEIEHAFKKAMVKNRRVDNTIIPDIISEKENIVKASGYLSFEKASVSFDSVGGLKNLKEWCIVRGKGFTKAAKDYGLSSPKGLLLLGVPGCGKSLTAKAIANQWNFPLVRLDMGSLYDKYIGESEKNIRNALAVAEAVSPCILWVDEIEKGVKGSRSDSDSGIASRIFGTFLTWLQDKTKPVFIVATANDVTSIPPEMLRKGRFDEIFFVDLPTQVERESILRIHLNNFKLHIQCSTADIENLARITEGFTGAEIEESIRSAMFKGFADDKKLIQASDIAAEIKNVYPLSQTMSGTINNLRVWAQSRCKLASSHTPVRLLKKEDETVGEISFSEFKRK